MSNPEDCVCDPANGVKCGYHLGQETETDEPETSCVCIGVGFVDGKKIHVRGCPASGSDELHMEALDDVGRDVDCPHGPPYRFDGDKQLCCQNCGQRIAVGQRITSTMEWTGQGWREVTAAEKSRSSAGAEGPVYFRCRRCGKVAAPHQIEPGDEHLPREDCACYMGPDWVRGMWIKSPSASGGAPPVGWVGLMPMASGARKWVFVHAENVGSGQPWKRGMFPVYAAPSALCERCAALGVTSQERADG